MKESLSLYRLLIAQQAPAAANYTESRAEHCFSPDMGQVQLRALTRLNDRDRASQPGEARGLLPVPSVEQGEIKHTLPDTLHVQHVRSFAELVEFRQVRHNHLTIFFIDQKTSRSRLEISLNLFKDFLELYELSAQLLDFACCFGRTYGEMEVAPPPIQFRWQVPPRRERCEHFDCTYILRFVELNHRGEKNPWSLRQTLIHHRHSPAPMWLFIGLSKSMASTVQAYIAAEDDTYTNEQFSHHLILIHATSATWRGYLAYIAEEVRNIAKQAILGQLAEEEYEGIHLGEFDFEERRYLKQLEDMVSDLMAAIDSALEVCSVLQIKHDEFVNADGQSTEEVPIQSISKFFTDMMTEKQRVLGHHRVQADALRKKIKSTEKLVTNILELGNGNTLKVLALESQKENIAIKAVTEKATRDAAAVKVLTIITLVYLPTTAVLNFFSTSFVNFDTDRSGQATLTVARNWWIALVVAVPLTVITLYTWWFYVKSFVDHTPPTWWRLINMRLERVHARQNWKRPYPRNDDHEMSGH